MLNYTCKRMFDEISFIPSNLLGQIRFYEPKAGRYKIKRDWVDDTDCNGQYLPNVYFLEEEVFLRVELYNLNGTEFSCINDSLKIHFPRALRAESYIVFDNFSRLARPIFSNFEGVHVLVSYAMSSDNRMNFLDFLNEAYSEALNKISITKKILSDQNFIKEIYLNEHFDDTTERISLRIFEAFYDSSESWKESYELPDYPVSQDVSVLSRGDDFCAIPLNMFIKIEIKLFNGDVFFLWVLRSYPGNGGILAFKKNEKKKRIYFSEETDFYIIDRKELEELEEGYKNWKLGSLYHLRNSKFINSRCFRKISKSINNDAKWKEVKKQENVIFFSCLLIVLLVVIVVVIWLIRRIKRWLRETNKND